MSIYGGTRMDSKQAARQVIFDRRLHQCCIVAAVGAVVIWIVALYIEYWYVVECPGGHYLRETGLPSAPRAYMMAGRSGIWRTCRILIPATKIPSDGFLITACRNMDLSSLEGLPDDDPMNVTIGYRRTSLAFSVLSVLMLLLAVFFSWYTLRVPRYTFKRVSGCLYFIVAAVEFVVINLLSETISVQEQGIPAMIPGGCNWSYSVSFILAWVCFTTHLVCGLSFIYTSGKKKKRTDALAPLWEAENVDDEPTIMGR